MVAPDEQTIPKPCTTCIVRPWDVDVRAALGQGVHILSIFFRTPENTVYVTDEEIKAFWLARVLKSYKSETKKEWLWNSEEGYEGRKRAAGWYENGGQFCVQTIF